jgi:hypothetical protein
MALHHRPFTGIYVEGKETSRTKSRANLKVCIAEELAASSPDNVMISSKAETPPEFGLLPASIFSQYRGKEWKD